jgi:hypothetical protein
MSRRNKSRKAGPHSARPRYGWLVMVCVVVFAVFLLLLRMLVYVHGHWRR